MSGIDWAALVELAADREAVRLQGKYPTKRYEEICAALEALPTLLGMVRGLAGALSELSLAEAVCDDGAARLTAARQRACAALATIPAALRAGVGDGE